MPSVTIEVRREYTVEQEIAIIEAVQSALVTHFKIPEKDKHIRFFAHLPHRFACPPHQDEPEFYLKLPLMHLLDALLKQNEIFIKVL